MNTSSSSSLSSRTITSSFLYMVYWFIMIVATVGTNRSTIKVVDALMKLLPLTNGYSIGRASCSRYRSTISPSSSSMVSPSYFTGQSLYMTTKRRSFVRFSPIIMMPEGPEVRTYVDQLQGGVGKRLVDIQFLSGRYVVHGRPEGFQSFASTMTPVPHRDGTTTKNVNDDPSTTAPCVDTIVQWDAKGKFIYIVLDDGSDEKKRVSSSKEGAADSGIDETQKKKNNDDNDDDDDDYQRSIWITLGMSGRFVNEVVHLQDPRYARWMIVLMDITSGKTHNVYYHDRRSFGTLKFSLSASALTSKLSSLGPDILNTDTTAEDVFLSILASQKPSLNICKFLMDQTKISGVGNYILSEGLYRAMIDPFASIEELDDNHRRRLFQQTQAVAVESYSSQGMTRRDGGTYRTFEGEAGTFAFQLQCYSQTVCPNGRPVIHETDGPHKRSIWYVEDQLFKPRSERQPSSSLNSMLATTMTLTDGTPSVYDSSEEEEELPIKAPPPVTKRKAIPKKSVTNNDEEDETLRSKMDKSKEQHTEVAASNLLDGLKDPSWRDALHTYTSSSGSFQRLQQFLLEEQESGVTIYPPQEDIFAALNQCPLRQTKLVILGQDPYHGPNQGHGLAFSVRRGIPPPPSLKNIFKEVMDDVGMIVPPRHGNLECWTKQGVLLLNTVLTVRRGEANSHANKGWEEFTDEVIRILNDSNNDGIVFLLWGRPAAQKARNVDTTKHVVIQTSHPSPLGASKTANPFLTSRCFSRANEALVKMGKQPIDWTVV